MDLVEDRSVFLGEFADNATLDGEAVRVVFDGPFAQQNVAEGVANTLPQVVMDAADLPAEPIGLPLIILTGEGAGTWRVAESHPDGTGMATLLLERTA